MSEITSIEELEKIYGKPADPSIFKEVSYLPPDYIALINASPMMILATSGPEGLDCTPRGDKRGFVRVIDEHTLMLPDRRGNNRVDSLRNIVHDNRVATLFLIPGVGTTLRVNGTAKISTDSELLDFFAMEGKLPRTVLIVKVQSAYFQCARAMVRSGIWNPETFLKPSQVPSPGKMLETLSGGNHDGKKYDADLPERIKKTLW